MTDLIKKDKEYIWHPFSPLKGQLDPQLVISAKDCTIKLADGSELIDAISSWWVNPLGHANKQIADAVYKQMLELEHVIFAGFTHKPAIDLAEKVIALNNGKFEKVFFSDNGSTSVEVALKIAIQHFHNQGKPKNKVISFKDAYHGDTFGAMAVGQKGSFFKPFEEMVFQPLQVDLPPSENLESYLLEFEQILIKEQPAAFIFEPLLLGAGGMKMYSAEALDKMIGLAQKHACICIADEVMTGFGRTGKTFAINHLVNTPDILCLSKCLTGGFMPLSLTLVNSKVIAAFDNGDPALAFYHGHSYTGNPLGCAAANKALELIDSEECRANWARINARHRAFASSLSNHKNIKNLRILGTVLAFDVQSGQEGYFSDVKKQLSKSFLASGVLLRPLGNVVYIMPPFIITNEELEKVYSAITTAISSLNEN